MSYVQALPYENLVDLRDRAREEVGKVVVGQGHAVDLLLVAALAQGHVLIEGPPGSAKTLLGRAMAHVLGAKFRRIQFTPDTTPDEITGHYASQDGRAGLHARRRLHERPPRRRDQPHAAAHPGCAARGDAGAHRHGRRARRTGCPTRSSSSRPRTRTSTRASSRCPSRSSTASSSRSTSTTPTPRARSRCCGSRTPASRRTCSARSSRCSASSASTRPAPSST